MKYLFKTTATMKEYNNKKWWIDSNIIRDITVEADNIDQALQRYRNEVETRFYVTISDNALKTKNPMYTDTAAGGAKQVGYVITGKTEFECRDLYKWVTQYIDLWVNVYILQDAFSGGADNE